MADRISNRGSGVKISRRDALRNLSAAGLGIAGLYYTGPDRSAAHGAETNPAGPTISKPIFTVAERDRRWEAIRRVMAKPQWNLDAILAPSSSDTAYPRYLTQIGGRGGSADVIFPRDTAKPVHAYTGSGRNRSFWSKRLSSWSADGKLSIEGDDGSKPVIAGLKALGLDHAGARIGVAKLTGSRFDSEGKVPANFLDHLKAALPGVNFLPIEKWGVDPGPIDEPAMVKSAEELEAVRRSAAAAEKAIDTIVRVARPPAKTQADIWFPTYTAMFAETGEDPIRLSIALDQPSNSTLGAPVDDPLKPGQIISQEIDASVQGYRAQVNHSIFVGGPSTPGFAYYRTAMQIAIGILQESLASVIPGKTTCGQLVDHYAALVHNANAEDRSGVVLHSSGISNLSRPRLGPSNSRGDADIVLVPGMAFDFKPALRLKRSAIEDIGRENRVVQVGEHYLITDHGAVRLGRREIKPIATETA